jgi:hypothetical protein
VVVQKSPHHNAGDVKKRVGKIGKNADIRIMATK